MTAYNLTRAGAKCLLLEAGGWYDTARDSKWLEWTYDASHRAGASTTRPFGGFEAVVGGWQIDGEPYANAPGSEWMWFRSRMLGGRTNAWGRIALRFGPYDFKPFSRDGKGFDWPISYEELAPYYDKVEELIGVFGSAEGMENLPDGKFLPPPEPRCYEKLVQKACGNLRIPCIPSRLAVLTRPLNGRPTCHYVGQCNRSCRMGANFSSPTTLLFPARETGNLEIRTDAMVRAVLTGPDGLATGVAYIDKRTGQEQVVRAKVVVLAASACETSRILLNSRSAQHPDGLGNANGMVGRYLMDSVMSDVSGYFPALSKLPPHNEDGVGGMHLYMPWWNYSKKSGLPFSRGYHIEFDGGRRGMPEMGTMQQLGGLLNSGYGAELKQKSRNVYGSLINFHGRGDMIPNAQSYCEIDKNSVDRWGIPTLRFHFQWGDEEIAMARHMQTTFTEIVHTAGGQVLSASEPKQRGGISRGGQAIHEVGGARMGNSPKDSVLDAQCRAWECKNLFVADGAPFVGQADKNPTLTILALAWRTTDAIVAQMRGLNG
jgi:choline dehydrogenase-like flavoprotein